MAKEDRDKVWAQDREDGKRIMAETAKKFEDAGLGMSYLLDRLKYLCEATKPIASTLISKSGKDKKQKDADTLTHDFVEVPDNQAIAKGVDMGFMLHGAYAPKQVKAEVDHRGLIPMDAVVTYFSENQTGEDKGKGRKKK